MGNQVVFIDQLAGLFVVEIQPLTTHLAVKLCDHPHRLPAGVTALVGLATHRTLCHTQFLHGVLKMPRIVNELPIGGDEKMRCTHVYTDALPGFGLHLCFDFTDIADVPLPAVMNDRRCLD